MSFNLGISGGNRLGNSNLFSIALYLYEDIFYRKWISEVALAFYEGRQDEFVWLDLVKQFRNPEKQQIVPLNFTKEIIDEISILYREQPIYKVKDKKTGKILEEDQELWEEVMKQARYHTMMDRLDRWCHLLGTVLVKVNYINTYTGNMAEEDDEDAKITLDLLHGGTYDVKYKGSPYHVNQLIIGFDSNFKGFGGGVSQTMSVSGNLGTSEVMHRQQVQSIQELNKVTEIFWSPDKHVVADKDQKRYEADNPYGMIPAVPFFNGDPAHYYFLPVNEPLLYMNHTLNMRMTDLNHIAKFQSFGVPVLSGVERGTNLRTGRPQDDFNTLKGGLAQSRFGGLGIGGAFGQGINFRNFDTNFGFFIDGNAEANALGFSLGPDTAISVGEKGDFKFASPNADITGLMKVIESMQDIVRVNHGLRPKFKQSLPSSGFAQLMEKIGVLEENLRRQKLFREREQQLFEVIKIVWNTHHDTGKDKRKFSDNAVLDITYVEPDFPVDPMTKMQMIQSEQAIIESGDTQAIKKIFKHKSQEEIKQVIDRYHKDRKEQTKRNLELQKMEREAQREMELGDADHQVEVDGKLTQSPLAVPMNAGPGKGKGSTSPQSKSIKSSIQPGKNGDSRKKV
jgi:hypothetical protein